MWWTSLALAQSSPLSDTTVPTPALGGAFLWVEDGREQLPGVFGGVAARGASAPDDGVRTSTTASPWLGTWTGPVRLGLVTPVVTWADGVGGLGDVRLDALAAFAPWTSVSARVWLPTSRDDRGAAVGLSWIASATGPHSRVALNMGPVLGAESRPGDRLGWLALVGASTDVADGARVGAEVTARIPFAPVPPPVVAHVTGAVALSRSTEAALGVGAGLSRGPGAPAAEVTLALRTGPPTRRPTDPPPEVDPDPDGDGLSLDDDACPLAAEDRDGAYDDDGCPEPFVVATVTLRPTPLPERWWVEVRDPSGVPVPGYPTDGGFAFLVPERADATLHVAVPGFAAFHAVLRVEGAVSVDVELQPDRGSAVTFRGDDLVPVVPIRAVNGAPSGLEPVLDTVAPLLWNAPWMLEVTVPREAWREVVLGLARERGIPDGRVVVATETSATTTFRLSGPVGP